MPFLSLDSVPSCESQRIIISGVVWISQERSVRCCYGMIGLQQIFVRIMGLVLGVGGPVHRICGLEGLVGRRSLILRREVMLGKFMFDEFGMVVMMLMGALGKKLRDGLRRTM
jgi:hypothetical protein